MNRNLNSLSAALGLLLTTTICLAENWPQWRGPRYDAISREAGLPTEWSESQNVVWKVQLPGIGSATPVVWGNRIFLTSQAGNDLLLLCFNTDGKEQWRHKLGESSSKGREEENNRASPSPATDGKLVFALVGGGDFTAVDFSGKEVWRFNAQQRYGNFSYDFGMHTTPLLYDGRLSPTYPPAPSSCRRPRRGDRQGSLESRPSERRPGRVSQLLRFTYPLGAERPGTLHLPR